MRQTVSADRARIRPASARDQPRTPHLIELWRLHGATDDLRGLVIETSFGYAFGLELDMELIWLHLQSSLESLVAQAERLESALIAHGWHVISERGARSERP